MGTGADSGDEMRIHSDIDLTEHICGPVSSILVKNEPMLFSCDFTSAYRIGGPLTDIFLHMLPESWREAKDLIVDSRVHMLMSNWFPCIPGWHHDDVPRSRSDGQPNYINPEYEAEHVMMLLGDDIASTQFALGTCEMPEIPLGQTIYKHWHVEVERLLESGELKLWTAPMNRLIYFNWQTFHQGVKATGVGWRFFIRATRNTHRKPFNEIRRQVQVYLEAPMEGW